MNNYVLEHNHYPSHVVVVVYTVLVFSTTVPLYQCNIAICYDIGYYPWTSFFLRIDLKWIMDIAYHLTFMGGWMPIELVQIFYFDLNLNYFIMY